MSRLSSFPRVPSISSLASLLLIITVAPTAWAQDASDAKVMGLVNGEEIQSAEVMERAAARLDEVEMQKLQCEATADQNRHQVVETTVQALVRQRLIASAAAAASLSPDEWQNGEVARIEGELTDQEIDRFFVDNKGRLRGTKEQLLPQVKRFLANQRFIADLEKDAEIEYFLEAYRRNIDAGGSPSKGPADAAVTIVEWSDFECPYCRRVAPTLDKVAEEFPNDVRLVFRQYPLASIHPNAQKAAEASLCAEEQDAFWKMHDLMFAEQKKLTVAELKEKADRLGLDVEAFNTCLDSGRHRDEVLADHRAGSIAGVTGTPAIFVNGRPMSGAVPYDQLSNVIREEIEQADSK